MNDGSLSCTRLVAMPCLVLLALLAPGSAVLAAEPTAGPAQAKPPLWVKNGVYVYKLFTPDSKETLPHAEEGINIVANLTDGTVPQVPKITGLIGHDHPGAWNWDGGWPYWNRVTFRAGNSWETLSGFMARIHKNSNAKASFHLNLTDVNVGLKDYPESREFFQKLVKKKTIYRRDNLADWATAPFVPTEIPAGDPVGIFALVNYKNFWDSGLAKEMIDGFYAKLPYAPPMLYLDVLNAQGGNFHTGYPDGPLGGSEQTQIAGMHAIADYLRSKGTDLGTEGNRPFLGANAQGVPRSGYVWYHGQGFSADDYSVITGGAGPVIEQTYGSAGAFAISPIASTKDHLVRVREHYAALLAGKTSSKKMPGLETAHVSMRSTGGDEFDIPGANGDVFRGDWADAVNNFYLINIQELYHIGKGNVRVAKSPGGSSHLDKCILTGPAGKEIVLEAEDFFQGWQRANFQAWGHVNLQSGQLDFIVDIAEPGEYNLKLKLHAAELNIYVNGEHITHKSKPETGWIPQDEWPTIDFGTVKLIEGANTISVDKGQVRAEWSDGTKSLWSTPALKTGFKVWRDDVVFAVDYDRMWPDTWSGQKKIYFFSWDGTNRAWKLPADWATVRAALLYPLTPDGRGDAVKLTITDRQAAPSLLPQVPYVLVPIAE